MSADEAAELRNALKALQDARQAGDAHGGTAVLERALLVTPRSAIDDNGELVVAAIRLLRGADDNGTTRLEVRDQGMTHRRWFEVNPHGEVSWGDR